MTWNSAKSHSRLASCGETRNAHVSVEERPFGGRVKHIESMRALAPVVFFGVPTDFFRSLPGEQMNDPTAARAKGKCYTQGARS